MPVPAPVPAPTLRRRIAALLVLCCALGASTGPAGAKATTRDLDAMKRWFVPLEGLRAAQKDFVSAVQSRDPKKLQSASKKAAKARVSYAKALEANNAPSTKADDNYARQLRLSAKALETLAACLATGADCLPEIQTVSAAFQRETALDKPLTAFIASG